MVQPFDWDLLRSFLAVARAGKLTAAARRLRIDHSTLSRRIAALEASLDARLFDRQPTGYSLTLQGERLIARAEEIESSVVGIRTDVSPDNTQVSGVVRIGSPDGFGTSFLAPRVGRLAAMHPDLDIELVAMPRTFSLSKREADIAIGLSPPSYGRLHGHKLTDYELGLYAARSAGTLAENLRSADDLRGRPFISYIDDLIYAPELDYLSSVARGIQPRLRSSNLIAQLQATVAGAGICVLPCFFADGDERLVRLLPEEVRLTRTFWMIVHSDMRDLARIRATTEFVLNAVREAGSLFLPRSREAGQDAPNTVTSSALPRVFM